MKWCEKSGNLPVARFLLIGMLAMGATTNFVSANFLLGLANLNNRGFVIERWHTVLTAWAVVLGALIYNVFLTRLLSKTGQGFLILWVLAGISISRDHADGV